MLENVGGQSWVFSGFVAISKGVGAANRIRVLPFSCIRSCWYHNENSGGEG